MIALGKLFTDDPTRLKAIYFIARKNGALSSFINKPKRG